MEPEPAVSGVGLVRDRLVFSMSLVCGSEETPQERLAQLSLKLELISSSKAFSAEDVTMKVERLTPILNVSNLQESFAWFEKLG